MSNVADHHFCSDNESGVHPRVLAAIVAANGGHVPSYGSDPLTAEVEARFREVFGADTVSYLVFNGTAANVVSAAGVVDAYQAVVCAGTSHIHFDECGAIERFAGCRVLVPTGMIFDTPEGYSVRLFSRSSVGIKRGLPVVNGVGVFDSDYFGEAVASLHNITNETLLVTHGERVAQAELVELLKYDLIETDVEPTQTTDRVGGFGSTGK